MPNRAPPPRRIKVAGQSKTVATVTQTVPLELLWMRIPSIQQQETLRRLTQMLVQRLATPANTLEANPRRREASDE